MDTLTGLGVPEETIGQIAGVLAPLRPDIVTAGTEGLIPPLPSGLPARSGSHASR